MSDEDGGGEVVLCTTLYYEGNEEEIDLDVGLALVEDGTITDETLVFSDDPAFAFEGWTGQYAAPRPVSRGAGPVGLT